MKKQQLFKNILLSLMASSLLAPASFALELDGTGDTGRAGVDGDSYNRRTRSNNRGDVSSRGSCVTTPGRHGTHGTDAGPGGRGADYNVTISDVGHILVTGTMTDYDGGSPRNFNISEQASITSVIQITADGGLGGRPGQGGNGEGAEAGQDSRDHGTSEYDDGGQGCDAGDPGRGGDSGTPGDGGDAGDIVVRLSAEDTHLLFAIRTSTEGGDPGDRLDGGRAGERARGGDGGDGFYEDLSGQYETGRMVDEPGCTSRDAYTIDGPCSWVNTVGSVTEDTEFVCEPDTHVAAVNCRQVPETEYRRIIKESDEGPRGSDSPSARDGDSSPRTATTGEDGTTYYEIVEEDGRVQRFTTANLIDLQMVDYELVEEDPNGIFEPNEEVRIVNLRIRNNGQIAYNFTKADTMIFLRSSNWLVADPQQLRVPRIEPGETITIADPELSFEIRSNRFQADSQAPRWQETIAPHNQITRVERRWNRLSLERSFYITYPVRLNSFNVPVDVEAGESVNFSWTVENLSRTAIPELGDFRRDVRTTLDFDSRNLLPAQLTIHLEGRDPGEFTSPVIEMISGLQPGEIRSVEGVLSVHANAEPYSTARLGVALEINQLGEENLTEIQRLYRDIRVIRVFRTRSDDDLLLVLTQSDIDIFRAWTGVFEKLGLKGNIWDRSVDGGFSFFNALESGGNLSSQFSNKTIVLPKLFEYGAPNPHFNSAHVDLYSAAEENNNSLYMIGFQPDAMQSILESTVGPTQKVGHRDLESFQQAFSGGVAFSASDVHEIGVQESYLFVRTPRMDKMFDIKNQVEAWLQENYPEDKFMVNFSYNPRAMSSGIWANYFLGNVIVRKSVQTEGAQLVLLPTQDVVESRRFIESQHNIRSLCIALAKDSKIKALHATAAGSSEDALTFRSVLYCVQNDMYQDWMLQPNSLDKTQQYLSLIGEIFASTASTRNEILKTMALMQVMAEDGIVNADITETLRGSFVSSLGQNDSATLESYKQRVRERISAAQNRSETDLRRLTKSTILKVVNPRTQTTGIEADEVSQ